MKVCALATFSEQHLAEGKEASFREATSGLYVPHFYMLEQPCKAYVIAHPDVPYQESEHA